MVSLEGLRCRSEKTLKSWFLLETTVTTNMAEKEIASVNETTPNTQKRVHFIEMAAIDYIRM